MNEPPDHTAELSAANLLSLGRDDRAEVLLDELGVLAQRGVHVAEEDRPAASRSSRLRWKTTSDSYCAVTPARYLRSASGMPSFS